MLTFILGVLTFIEVLTAVFLIGIILIQESKSGGGLGAVAGGVTESVFGASAGNVLTKTTVILAAVFLVNTLALNVITGHRRPALSVAETAAPAEKKSDTKEEKKAEQPGTVEQKPESTAPAAASPEKEKTPSSSTTAPNKPAGTEKADKKSH